MADKKETNNSFQHESVINLQLASMDDLVRMAFFSASRNLGLNFLLFKDDNKTNIWSIGFLTGVAGYFSLRGLPMYFYVELTEKPKSAYFIRYNSLDKEKWEFCSSTSTSTVQNYLPVIELIRKPSFF